MDQMTPLPLGQSLTPQFDGQRSSADDQGKVTKSIEHELDTHQSDLDHVRLSHPSLTSPRRNGQLVPANRPQLVKPETHFIVALTRGNVRQLEKSLGDRMPMPMARWEAETKEDGVWHHLDMIASEHNAQRPLLKVEGLIGSLFHDQTRKRKRSFDRGTAPADHACKYFTSFNTYCCSLKPILPDVRGLHDSSV
jgi:hypothetical protein